VSKGKRDIKIRWSLVIVFIIAALLALLALDSRLRLVSSKYELFYDNLPGGFDGYRIVQLSDLHMRQFGEDNEKLIDEVKKQEPDIIVLTGDFLNRKEKGAQGGQTKALEPFLRKLALIAPCYFVNGNHEWASGELSELAELLKELDIKYLHNEFVLLEEQGQEIILAGAEDPNGPADMKTPDELVEIIRNNYPESFIILLTHRNNLAEKYPELPVDLIICGHAHGGIIRIPFVGGLLGTEKDFFPRYDGGLFEEEGFNMVLSRGLGDYISVPRILNNPEIVTIILRKGG
jgi:predicted MPP superfamily phosphohydrolase